MSTDTDTRVRQHRLDTDQTFALGAWLREHKDTDTVRQSRRLVAEAATAALGFVVTAPALERVAGSKHVAVRLGRPEPAASQGLLDLDERLESVEARIDAIVASEGDVLQRLARLESALLPEVERSEMRARLFDGVVPGESVDTETSRWKLEQRHGTETVALVQRRIDDILLTDDAGETSDAIPAEAGLDPEGV